MAIGRTIDEVFDVVFERFVDQVLALDVFSGCVSNSDLLGTALVSILRLNHLII